MRGVVFASAIVAAFCFYVTLQLLFGAYGVYPSRDTRRYIRALEQHVEELQRIQERLKADVVALQINERRIEEEAQRIGYYDARDIVIRRTATTTAVADDNTFGHYLAPSTQADGDSRTLFRWMALTVGLLCLIFFALMDGGVRRDPHP